MLVFPIGFILGERFLFRTAVDILPLIGKWFVFWTVGVRLFTAGLRQIWRPQFTAQKILLNFQKLMFALPNVSKVDQKQRQQPRGDWTNAVCAPHQP